MKKITRVSILFFMTFLLSSCGKEERTQTIPGDKENLYRDWSQKGERTINPELEKIFEGNQKSKESRK